METQNEQVRSIVYFWWRKAEENLRIIKFGDHTEPLSKQNWYESTEKYIQRTAAPRESATWKKTIEYQIFDITEYAKKVHRNRKYAKVDNYIAKQIDVERYRIGQTDQFELPQFGIDFNDFICKVRDLVYGNHTSSKSLPICMSITARDLDLMNDNQVHTFTKRDPLTNLTFMMSFLPEKIFIITDIPEKYIELISEYTAFNNYLVAFNNVDGRFSFAEKKIFITTDEVSDIDFSKYDFVIRDKNILQMQLLQKV